MNRFFKRVFRITLILIVMGNLLSYICLKIHANGNFYKPAFVANSNQAAVFDYVVLGASTGLTTIDTKLIDSVSGKNGLNLAMDDTSISSSYLMLQHFLAQGNTTKTCILAPAITSYNDPNKSMSTNDYRFAMFADQPYVKDYYSNIEEKSTSSKILSVGGYFPAGVGAYYNAELIFTSLYVLSNFDKRNRFDDRGNYTYPSTKKNRSYKRKKFEVQFTNPYLEKLQSLCDENNITLLYFIPPVANKTVNFRPKKNVIDYSSFIENSEFFYDVIHVNSKGRAKVSRELAFLLNGL